MAGLQKGRKSLQKSELCGSMKLVVQFIGIKLARPAPLVARQSGFARRRRLGTGLRRLEHNLRHEPEFFFTRNPLKSPDSEK
jgi:hypothetical protein